jgi:PAS domain S-box-containing protein
MRDITKRKRAEEALRASEVRYRRLFETAKDGILILDAETGMIVDVNPFLVEMLGFSHEQFMGKAIWEIGFFKDIASNKDKFIELQRRRYVRYENLPLETADGRQIEVEFVSNVYTVDYHKVVQCNLRDITERKREEREIEEKLMETMKMKSDFISMVSHELRTPLTVIKEGIALIADGSMGEINEEQKELLGLSKKHVDRLAKFINAVLDLQKLEVGGMKLNAQPNDINEIVRDVYEMMTLATKDRGADLLLELDDRLPRVGFDNDKITQVLTNLVANAMKFTEKGNIVIKTSKKNGMIHVSVSDTGCGIEKKDLSRVFGRFEQLSTGGERKTGGTGLGLAISKGIIEQHNGEIWVDSVFGKGSKFTFTLPIYNIEEPFRKYVNDGIKEASTNNTRMSLVFISIADFDKLKQKLSHEKITSTLKDVEAILENDLHRGKGRPNQITDTVFRFSNEIFIVLANCSKENIPVVKERLEQKLDDYLADKNLVDKVKLFFGCVTYPDDAVTSEELIKKAKELHPIVSTALSV